VKQLSREEWPTFVRHRWGKEEVLGLGRGKPKRKNDDERLVVMESGVPGKKEKASGKKRETAGKQGHSGL